MGSLNKHLTNMIKLTDIVAPHQGCQQFPALCAYAIHVFLFTEFVAVEKYHIFCTLLFRIQEYTLNPFFQNSLKLPLKIELLVIVSLYLTLSLK